MSHAPSAALSRRHEGVRAAIAARGLDGLVVTSLPNVLYLTNFTGSAAIVVIGAQRVSFLTDARYVAAIDDTRGTPHECPALDAVIVEGSYDARLAEFLRSGSMRFGPMLVFRQSCRICLAVPRSRAAERIENE